MTVRRLTNQDRPALHALLREAPAQNLYLLGNLETLGFDHELCEFWGDWDAQGVLRAVLNRYMTGWSCYGRAPADWAALAQVLDAPEFAASDNVRRIVQVLEERTILDQVVDEYSSANEIQVIIAGEGRYHELQEISLVLSRYGVDDQATGMLGVVGPLRMSYGRNIGAVRFVAMLMSDMVQEIYGPTVDG